jgi:hypothetical protein
MAGAIIRPESRVHRHRRGRAHQDTRIAGLGQPPPSHPGCARSRGERAEARAAAGRMPPPDPLRPPIGWRRERLGVAPRFDYRLPVSLRPLRPRARPRRTTRKCTRACRVHPGLHRSLQPPAPRPTRTTPKESASTRARRIPRPSLRPRTRFHSNRRSARRRTRRRPRPAHHPSQRRRLSSP